MSGVESGDGDLRSVKTPPLQSSHFRKVLVH